MENNEKNPTAHRAEGRSEGGEGKRPQGGQNHNRNRNHNHHRNPNQNQNQNQNQNNGSGGNRNNPTQNGGRPKNGGNEPQRGGKEPEARHPSTPSAQPQPAKSNEEARRSTHATGRPQRNIRRATSQADLPDMDNLLIEDTGKTDPPAPVSDDAPDAAEVERILERDIFEKPVEVIPEVLPEGKLVIAGIRFRAGGKNLLLRSRSADLQGGSVCHRGDGPRIGVR